GKVQPEPIHGRGDEQIEILREEEARERCDDVREYQDGYEGEQDQAENLAGNERSQLLDFPQIPQNQVQHAEDAGPERPADDDQDDELAAATLLPFLAQPLQRGAPLRRQHVRERRLLHAPRTSIKSRT